jgi:uncharacterized protein YdhG (YjbR/CyaY superfamily)
MTQTTKKPAANTAHTKTVDDYLAAAPKDKRAALMKLRKTIKAAAPQATESMSYGVAAFKHPGGKPIIYFGYWKDHYALYGIGSAFIKTHAAELKAYDVSKGTIRFPLDKPLPHRLVTKIVKARIAEIEKAG